MKAISIVTFLIISFIAFGADFVDFKKWEVAASVYLNKPALEIYALRVDGIKVTFEYHVEHPTNPYLDETFLCEGIGELKENKPFFIALECEEEEPYIWDEFQNPKVSLALVTLVPKTFSY